MLAKELCNYQYLYIAACIRYQVLIDTICMRNETNEPIKESGEAGTGKGRVSGDDLHAYLFVDNNEKYRVYEKQMEDLSLDFPSLVYDAKHSGLHNSEGQGHRRTFHSNDFVTGLMQLNRMTIQMRSLNDSDRKKILFGSDQIVP